jgi:hypothetical protein
MHTEGFYARESSLLLQLAPPRPKPTPKAARKRKGASKVVQLTLFE